MKTSPARERPRLLVLTSTFPRWADDTEPAFVFELCRSLAAEWAVTVLAPHAAGASREEHLDGLRVLRFRYAPEAWEKLAYEGGMMANLRRRPWLACLLPFFFAALLWRAWREFCAQRPTAAHAHWIVPQGVALAAALALAGQRPRAICTSHGSDVTALHGPLWRMLRRMVAARLDCVVAVSEALRGRLVEEGCPPDRIDVIPMGADLTGRFSPSSTARSPSEILFVGRLAREKGADILLRAMPRILALQPEATLTLIGDGPEKVSLRETAASLDLAGRVRFAGALPNAVLPEHYRRAALLVLPSRREGFGLTLVEALGCGCPVAASDLPAPRALLEDGRAGRLFRAEDPDALARAVLELLADPAAAAAMAVRGRAAVVERYDWGVIARRYGQALSAGAR